MLDVIRTFLQENFMVSADTKEDDDEVIRLSAALLFVEVMQADHTVDERERAAATRALQESFGISRVQAEAILKKSEKQAGAVVSLHELTSTLNQHMSIEDKISLLEQIWKIILADDNIDRYEEHLVRKIADLLHLRHSEYIKAKLHVVEAGSPGVRDRGS